MAGAAESLGPLLVLVAACDVATGSRLLLVLLVSLVLAMASFRTSWCAGSSSASGAASGLGAAYLGRGKPKSSTSGEFSAAMAAASFLASGGVSGTCCCVVMVEPSARASEPWVGEGELCAADAEPGLGITT